MQWRGHTLKVTGNWVGRYLFLAPQYELWIDDERLDTNGGPRLRPTLEAIIEEEPDEQGQQAQVHHLRAEILSIAGMRPMCELTLDGELLSSDRVRVANVLNPFLILFIMSATAWMLYIGAGPLRAALGL